MNMFDYTILSYCTDEGQTNPNGVILQISNGDTQYLTIEEFETFTNNQEKLKKQI